MPGIDNATILFQTGALGVFVWFVLTWSDRMAKSQSERDAAMRKFWDDQRSKDQKILADLTASVRTLADLLNTHDKKTDIAIAHMEERTRSRSSTRKS